MNSSGLLIFFAVVSVVLVAVFSSVSSFSSQPSVFVLKKRLYLYIIYYIIDYRDDFTAYCGRYG